MSIESDIDSAKESIDRTSRSIKFAVTRKGYDDIGAILRELGAGYRFNPLELNDLTSESMLSQYKAIFINCAEECMSFEQAKIAGSCIRSFVEKGGTVYASDWAAIFICNAFPEPDFIQFMPVKTDPQQIDANVLDHGFAQYLGVSQVALTFDKNNWIPIDSVGTKCTVYLIGTYTCEDGEIIRVESPLLVSFQHGKGHVVYTTFHNEVLRHFNPTQLEQKLLRFLVLKPLTSGLSTESTIMMQRKAFNVEQHVPGLINPGQTSDRYECLVAGSKTLKVILNWEGNARLKLSIYQPNGKIYKEEVSDRAPLIIEVPEASTGIWMCSVTAVEVPHENFKFVLTSGLKGSGHIGQKNHKKSGEWSLVSPILMRYSDGVLVPPKYIVGPSGITIGRGAENDIDLGEEHRTVSRNHAVIERHGDDFVIRNCSEVNPVEVNGNPIDNSVVLRWWDLLTFGEVTLCIVNDGDEPIEGSS